MASLIGVLALGFVEGLGRFYPARATWRRLRRARGRDGMKAMRERFEAAAERRVPRLPTTILVGLAIVWIATASLLDKRWYEVVLDELPYAVVLAALLRTPVSLRRIAARMKDLERDAGDEPDAPDHDGGPGAVAL